MLEVDFNPFPVLYTERLCLRRITPDDANDLYLLRSDREVMKYIDRPLAGSVEEIVDLINMVDAMVDSNEAINWGIYLKDSPELIGTIGYWRMQKEHYRAEIGYLLGTRFHRKGIMHEALVAALDYGFRSMRLHSVEARVSPGNIGSMALLEKNGFIREGYFRENHFYNGEFLDTVVYSLLTR